MVRRALWLSAGMAVGAASTASVMRRVRRRVERYAPRQVGAGIRAAVGNLAAELRSAANAGHEAMRYREAQLWAELDPRDPGRNRLRAVPGAASAEPGATGVGGAGGAITVPGRPGPSAGGRGRSGSGPA